MAPKLFAVRDAKLSVNKRVKELFTAPDAIYSFDAAYNVYNEDDFQNKALTTVFPFIFLLMSRVPPKETRLPMIIMDFPDWMNLTYEVGNRAGALMVVHLEIFGRNRGERDGLAGYIRQAFTDKIALNMYDFSTTPAPTLKYTTTIDGLLVTEQSVAPEVGIEGALNNWNTLSFECQLRD